MGFTAAQKDLVRALKEVEPAVGHDESNINSYVLIRSGSIQSSKDISISAFNTGVYINAKCKAVYTFPFQICIPHHRLLALISLFEDEVSIQIEDSRVIVSSGKSIYQLPCRSAIEFPSLAVEQTTADYPEYLVSATDLASCLSLVEIAMATAETGGAWNLCCVNLTFDTDEDKIKLLTCDGKQLARAMVKATNNHEDISISTDVLIPAVLMPALKKVLMNAEVDEEISVTLVGDKLQVKTLHNLLLLTPMVGRFPAAETIIAPNKKYKFEIVAGDLRAAVKRCVSILVEKGANAKSEPIRKALIFKFKTNELIIETENTQRGMAKETLSTELIMPGMEEIHVYPPSIIKVVELFTRNTVLDVRFDNGKNPIEFRTKEEYFDFIYLTMPLVNNM